MKKNCFSLLLSIVVILTLASTLHAVEPVKIRLGWQIPWAIQGQLVQILKHTDILKKRDIEMEFIGRTYGPELNEAALAGQLDVILTADQPAATLLSKTSDWVIIGRLMYNRTTTYVPPNSPIKKMADLKGKTIGVPIGAAAERILIASLRQAGLNPARDVKIINLGMLEHAPLIKGSGPNVQVWGQFDALSGFDPIPAILEVNQLTRTIDTGKVVSLVLMSRQLIAKSSSASSQMMLALADAYYFYAKNQHQADDWFLAEARLSDATYQACQLAASLEPNLKAQSYDAIRMSLNEDDIRLMQQGADFMAEKLKRRIVMRDFILDSKLK